MLQTRKIQPVSTVQMIQFRPKARAYITGHVSHWDDIFVLLSVAGMVGIYLLGQ